MNRKLLNKIGLSLGLLSACCFTSNSKLYADALANIATPVSNPVNFEDPRINSELRPIYAHHVIDNGFVTQGGEVDIFAVQARFAVSDRLAIIATKDGIVSLRPNAVLDDQTGLANLAGGVKYAFYVDNEAIATAGLRYEAPTGAERVLQGKGSGIINPFVSAAVVEGQVNLMGYAGLRLPFSDNDSSFYDISLHADTDLGGISPLLELNLCHVMSAGDRLGIPDEGQDFFNIGSSTSSGENMLTGAAGFRVPLMEKIALGATYEFPLVHGAGTRITDWRLTTDLVVSF